MRMFRVTSVTLLCALLLQAEDFTLKYFDDGPITVHTTLTFEGKGERLIATAKNESNVPIQRAKICIASESVKKGCLFEVWNTAVWAPGTELSWNLTTSVKVPDLTHDAMIEEYSTVKTPDLISEKQPAASPSPHEPFKVLASSAAVDTLTNETLVRMTKAGLNDEVILGMVNNQPGKFLTSPDAVISLKEAGVSEHVIAAIVNRTTLPNKSSDGTASSTKPRVYVSDSESWTMAGGFSASRGTGSGFLAGGSSPQTVELVKTFGERCPSVVVTMDRAKADYVVLFDREGTKGVALKRNKIAVFKSTGDVLYSDSTRTVGSAVEDSCKAIKR